MKIRYEIVDFDEALEAYIVKYGFKNEIHTVEVTPVVDESTNNVDKDATFFQIEQQIRSAHSDPKPKPTNFDKLIG